MALIVNTTNTGKYIKYKGKLYVKTDETKNVQQSPIITPDKDFNSYEEGVIAETTVVESVTSIRPIYVGVTEIDEPIIEENLSNNSFDVRVINKNNLNPFFNQGSSTCLSISGYQNLELNLISGKSYYFHQKDASNIGNRLRLTLDSQGLQNANFANFSYNGTPGVDGVLFFIAPINAQQTYYLSSEGGQYMGIKINVDVYHESLPVNVANFNFLSASSYYTLIN